MIPNLPKPEIRFDFTKKIFAKESALSVETCEELINTYQSEVHKGEDKYPELFTTSFHTCLLPLNHPVHDELQNTYSEIKSFFDFNLSFAEPYEIKRYEVNDYFGTHMDNYCSLIEDIDRKLTFVAFLSNDQSYTGGELNVFNRDIKMKQGSVVAFPSFVPHCVNKVSSGERWSMITWLWGSYWK